MSVTFPTVPDLAGCLRRLWSQVPAGRVTTCGDLARALGNPVAATWIGYYTLHHEHGDACPCHRVLRAGGALGGYVTGSAAEKIERLRDEGVIVSQGAADLNRFGFDGFATDRPLIGLRDIQEEIQSKISLRPRRRIPKLVGGVDVSYPSPDTARAAYALVETESGRLVWATTVSRPVAFPYISTYLGFREIPILLDLLDAVRSAGRLSEVLLVDGSGVLHHRHAGVASHLGVVASLPTVGVTKKPLFGDADIDDMVPGESRPVFQRTEKRTGPICDGQPSCRSDKSGRSPFPLGIALRPTAKSRRPIFISPGHRVDLEFSERFVRRLLTGRRLPEPLYWADRISRIGELQNVNCKT